MVKMNQSLHRLQGTWRDTQLSGDPAAAELREQFERLMTVYLSTKAATTQPTMLQNCLNLQASCAALLVQLSLGNQGPEHIPLTFPLPALENSLLCFVPGIPSKFLCSFSVNKLVSTRAVKILRFSRVLDLK